MAPHLVLIHSPLVGPLTWRDCATELGSLGHHSIVPTLAGVIDASPPWIPKLAARIVQGIGDEHRGGVVLIVHSGAGSLVPAAIRDLGARARGAVFVDAGLPRPGQSVLDTAPAAFRERLLELGSAGMLPPWNEWFPPGSIASHLPDSELYDRFVAELPRLPLAYFREAAPEARGWDSLPCGYVQLSDAYADPARDAAARGWPVLHHASDHLAMLTQPEAVARAIDRVLQRMGMPRPARSG